MTDKHNIDNIPKIVPERDELASHGGRQRRGNSLSSAPARRSKPAGNSGATKFLLGVLLLGMFASAGAGYFFYTQGQDTLAALTRSEQRIGQLESRLSMVDEASEQSSMGLLERVDFNFSEIDKLWAARNQNRSDIAANTASIAKQVEADTAMERVISGQSSNVNQNTTLLTTIQTRIETINTALNRISSLDQQLAVLTEDLRQLKASMPAQDSNLAARIRSNEQDIESINIFRLQLNQTINALKNNVNILQEQLEPQI